jgi:hypothetical protein
MHGQVGMDLRVLHTAAFRNTWYGRWGYGFGRGGFGISRPVWRRSAEAVAKAPLDDILADFAGEDKALVDIIDRYRVELTLQSMILPDHGDIWNLVSLLSTSPASAVNPFPGLTQ